MPARQKLQAYAMAKAIMQKPQSQIELRTQFEIGSQTFFEYITMLKKIGLHLNSAPVKGGGPNQFKWCCLNSKTIREKQILEPLIALAERQLLAAKADKIARLKAQNISTARKPEQAKI